MSQVKKLKIVGAFTRQFKRSDNSGIRTKRYYVVECVCGSKQFEISEYRLFYGSGQCMSCNVTDHNSNRTHNESDCLARGKRRASTPEYRAWKSIKVRCYNRNFKQYKDYGGRGIRVCGRWLESYYNFLADIGRRPSTDHSIQRRDNDGNYCPDNCYWATDAEQRRNRRTTVNVTINGVTKCVTDWCRHLGIPKSTYWSRIKQRGMSPLEALTR